MDLLDSLKDEATEGLRNRYFGIWRGLLLQRFHHSHDPLPDRLGQRRPLSDQLLQLRIPLAERR
jgi:hypothetical protein